MLDLNHLRAEFARYLATNTETRWGMDAALMHVCRMAYEAGRADADRSPLAFVARHNGVISLPAGATVSHDGTIRFQPEQPA